MVLEFGVFGSLKIPNLLGFHHRMFFCGGVSLNSHGFFVTPLGKTNLTTKLCLIVTFPS